MKVLLLAGVVSVLMVGFLMWWGPIALLVAMAILVLLVSIVAAFSNYQDVYKKEV